MADGPEWFAKIKAAKDFFENECVDSTRGRLSRMAVIGLDALARDPELQTQIAALTTERDAARADLAKMEERVAHLKLRLAVASVTIAPRRLEASLRLVDTTTPENLTHKLGLLRLYLTSMRDDLATALAWDASAPDAIATAETAPVEVPR